MALVSEKFYADAAKRAQGQRHDLFPPRDTPSNNIVADRRQQPTDLRGCSPTRSPTSTDSKVERESRESHGSLRVWRTRPGSPALPLSWALAAHGKLN
jgi:hypothetical protein